VGDLVNHLHEARRALAGAGRINNLDERAKAADQLMEAIWHIGTAIYAAAGGAEPARPPELAAFIADTAERLYEAESGLSLWLFDARSRRPEDDSSNRGILRDRSAIEFLRDLYKGTAVDDYITEIGTDSFDEEIRFRADQYNVGTPPPGIPRHHWWWWTP
jgi:hypothetical protein